MNHKPANSPPCFGSILWSASAVECIGGSDPAYENPKTGTNVRDRCNYYSSCASAVSSSRAQQPQLMQIRQNQPGMQGPPRPVPMIPRPQNFVPQPQYPQPFQQQPTQQYMQPTQSHYGVQYAPPYVAQNGPAIVAVPYQQPGHQMPSYLTVPEPVNLNESGWRRLVREIVRSMAKSAGHTTASFFDHNPMRAHQMPVVQANPDQQK